MTNPNNHPLCSANYCIQVRGPNGVVNLKVSDTCPSCKAYDIDIANTIYNQVSDPNKGRVQVTWEFVDCSTLFG